MPKERGIIFQGWGIKAIGKGLKTQTRRIIKPQPHGHVCWKGYVQYGDALGRKRVWCPYGQVGDLLYCREAWRINSVGCYCEEHRANHVIDVEYSVLPGDARGDTKLLCGTPEQLIKATHYYNKHQEDKSSPSIFMPKWAARHWLKLTDVRVQRWFEQAWDSINAKRGYGWDVNPWLWALTFERIDHGKE